MRPRSIRRREAAAAVGALALVASGCGGAEPDAGDGRDGRYLTPAQATLIARTDAVHIVRGGNRAEIVEALEDAQVDFVTGSGSGVCAELTSVAQRELEARASDGADCEEVVTEIARRSRRAGVRGKISAVREVTIDGQRATALLKDPGNPEPYRVELLLEEAAGWGLVSLEDVEPDAFAAIEKEDE